MICVGNNQKIIGNNKTVVGNNNFIKGNNCIITGNNNKVFGNEAQITGNHNILQGNAGVITGNYNVCRGNNNRLNGKYNKITGNNNRYKGAHTTFQGISNDRDTSKNISTSTITITTTTPNGSIFKQINNGGISTISTNLDQVYNFTPSGMNIYQTDNLYGVQGNNTTSNIIIRDYGTNNIGVQTGLCVNNFNSSESSESSEELKEPTYPDVIKNEESAQKNEKECIICFDRASKTCIFPCGHACLCVTCSLKLKENKDTKCPLCKKKYTNIKRIYQ